MALAMVVGEVAVKKVDVEVATMMYLALQSYRWTDARRNFLYKRGKLRNGRHARKMGVPPEKWASCPKMGALPYVGPAA